MYRNKSIAVIMPAYNEESTIAGVIKAVPDFVDAIVVVDDCSTDETALKAKEAGAEVITHHVNQGVGAAFHSGMEYVLDGGFDIIANIDADGQFSPDTADDDLPDGLSLRQQAPAQSLPRRQAPAGLGRSLRGPAHGIRAGNILADESLAGPCLAGSLRAD